MRLFHITFDLWQSKEKTFTPRIPTWILDNKAEGRYCSENETIPRICFSDSIKTAIQAIGYRDVRKGEKFLVYTLDVDEDDPALKTPEYLFSHHYVPDALENREYWYLEEVTLYAKEYIITEVDCEYDFAWTIVTPKDIKEITKNLLKEKSKMMQDILKEEYTDSHELYDDICHIAWEKGEYNFLDDLYDEIAESIPWSQLIRIKHLKLA